MKKSLLLVVCLMGVFGLKAQITLDEKDILKKDKIYRLYQTPDSVWWKIGDTVDFGESGANGEYDLRNISKLGVDTNYLMLSDLSNFSWAEGHANANAAAKTDAERYNYREPIQFEKADFPKAGDTFMYTQVNPNLSSGVNLMDYLWLDDGSNASFWFDVIDLFDSENGDTVLYLDPKNTPFGATITDATVARLREFETFKGDTVVQVLEYFKEENGDFLNHAIGARVDKGFLTTQSPSQSYANVTTTINTPNIRHSSNLKYKDSTVSKHVWRASFTEGLVEYRHFDQTDLTTKVMGYGILYLPQDSFEVMQIGLTTIYTSVDSIFLLGNLSQIEESIDTSYEIYYYTKEYAEPVLQVEINSDTTQVLSCSYLNVPNKTVFNEQKSKEVTQFYGFFNIEDEKVALTGLTIIADQGLMMSDEPTGILDTFIAPYDSEQLIVSTDMVYGFGHADTVRWSVEFDQNASRSVELKTTEIRTVGVEGYGTLYLNEDTADVLRVRIIKEERIDYTLKFMGFPLFSFTDTTFTHELEFWGKEAQVPLAKAEFDGADLEFPYSCEYTDVPEIIVGVNKIKNSGLAIYPNPTNGLFNVSDQGNNNYLIKVLDVSGKLVYNSQFNKQISVDTRSWDKGMYLVKLVNAETGSTSVERLIVE